MHFLTKIFLIFLEKEPNTLERQLLEQCTHMFLVLGLHLCHILPFEPFRTYEQLLALASGNIDLDPDSQKGNGLFLLFWSNQFYESGDETSSTKSVGRNPKDLVGSHDPLEWILPRNRTSDQKKRKSDGRCLDLAYGLQ